MTEMPSLCQHSTDKHDAIGCWRQLGRPTRPGLEAAEKNACRCQNQEDAQRPIESDTSWSHSMGKGAWLIACY
jgi:hypothetical protein